MLENEGNEDNDREMTKFWDFSKIGMRKQFSLEYSIIRLGYIYEIA